MFTDKLGRVWDLTFTYADVLRLRKPIESIAFGGVDLIDIESVIDCLQDDEQLIGLLYALGKAEERALSFEQFAAGFDGSVFYAAQEELWKAIETFSPSDRREVISRLVAKIKAVDSATVAAAVANLSNDPSLSVLESSGSTQGPSPSER